MTRFAVLCALLLPPAAAAAQEPATWLLERGQLELFGAADVSLFDERFGLRTENGRTIEEVEPLGFDFSDAGLGARLVPGLEPTAAELGALIGDSAFAVDLGSLRSRLAAMVLRAPLGARVGVTDWLTVGVRVPLVRRRVTVDLAFDPSSASVGQSPGAASEDVTAYFLELQGGLDLLVQSVESLCAGAGETDPACVEGRATVDEASSFRAALSSAYGGDFFFLDGSAGGGALRSRWDAVRARMLAAGDSAALDAVLLSAPPLAAAGISEAAFQGRITDPAFGVAGLPLQEFESVWELGDIEVGAWLRLLSLNHGAAQPDEAPPAFRLLLGAGGLLRLGTGQTDLPDDFVDIGSGDGQTDIEVRGFGLAEVGARARVSGEVRYGVQLEGDVVRRVSAPSDPIAPLSERTGVRWDPGDYLEVLVRPDLVLTPELSLGLVYRYASRGEDRHALLEGLGSPSRPVELLDRETEATVQYLGVSGSLRPSAGSREAGQWPIAIAATYSQAVSGSGGRTPKDRRFTVSARLFVTLW